MEKFYTKTFEANIGDLKPNPNNPRKITKKDMDTLVRSMRDFPEMRAIREVVIDEDFNILGGHQRVEALKKLKETTVPVKQVFGLTEEQKKEFIVKDNKDNGTWDFDLLMNGWDTEKLLDWGIGKEKDFRDPQEVRDELVEIDIPVYTPSPTKPSVSTLVDNTTRDALLDDIEKLDCPNEIKDILRTRAAYFADLNFQKIADYYAHEQDESVKEMFRKLGMVIVTPPEAIELGIAKLTKRVVDNFEDFKKVRGKE